MDIIGNIDEAIINFQNFFSNIDQSKLDRLHSKISQRIKKKVQQLTFEQAKEVFLKYIRKDSQKNKINWKQDQVQLFIYIVDKTSIKYQLDFQQFNDQIWQQISNLISGRTPQNCKTKMISLVPANLNQTPWTQTQQQILREIIGKYGTEKWKVISLKLFERNPTKIYRSSKQCRQRYMCFLKPDLKKGFWTDKQDYQLINLYLRFGRKWSKMVHYIKGRNQNAIKNRFFLLFEQSSKNQRLYFSEFIRKVMRRKEKLQKILKIKNVPQKQQLLQVCKVQESNLEIMKSQDYQTSQKDLRNQEIIEIEKFFTF